MIVIVLTQAFVARSDCRAAGEVVLHFVAAATIWGAAIANDRSQWRITVITNQRFL
jgi:hypothetical protein